LQADIPSLFNHSRVQSYTARHFRNQATKPPRGRSLWHRGHRDASPESSALGVSAARNSAFRRCGHGDLLRGGCDACQVDCEALASVSLGAKRRSTPPAVGFPQKKVFEHELRFVRGKRSSARWARYPGIDAVRQRFSSNHLIERPAMRADEIDLCGLDQRVFGCRNGHWTAAMTLT
jgi:hypothetical protein